jgi:hypothetical protein
MHFWFVILIQHQAWQVEVALGWDLNSSKPSSTGGIHCILVHPAIQHNVAHQKVKT